MKRKITRPSLIKLMIPRVIILLLIGTVIVTASWRYQYQKFHYELMQEKTSFESATEQIAEECVRSYRDGSLSGQKALMIKRLLGRCYSEFGESGVLTINGEVVASSREDAFAEFTVINRTAIYEIRSIEDLASLRDHVTAVYGRRALDHSSGSGYEFILRSVYYDSDTCVFIPGMVDILRREDNGTTEVIDSFDCAPADTEGYEYAENIYFCIDQFNEAEREQVALEWYGDDGAWEELAGALAGGISTSAETYGGETVYYNVRWYQSPDAVYEMYTSKNAGMFIISCIIVVLGSFLISFVISYIRYVRAKALYDMFEYRRKMTDALAHDLKTPIAVISAYAENLKEDINPSKREHYTEKIIENVGSMKMLIDNTLNFSRIESGKVRISPEQIDIGSLAGSILEEQSVLFEKRNIGTVIDDSETYIVSADKILMRQALQNLIVNMAVHAPEGTDAFIRVFPDRIEFENMTDLKDIGTDKLFEAFVKGDSSRGEQGTGLGLAVTRSDLQIMGFKIKAVIKDRKFTVTVRN
ncbi:MAG: HAMP domain-containing histidine kinase [Clostridiales bacterium]|nr:HAMP domain-containing histidine kinase [Clostridiales bacterium]